MASSSFMRLSSKKRSRLPASFASGAGPTSSGGTRYRAVRPRPRGLARGRPSGSTGRGPRRPPSVGEVMEFANNYYAEVKERDTGIGAMELLINRPGSRVYAEPGPNMMWNNKYGMMAGGRGMGGMMGPGGRGMMGGYSSAPPRNAQGDKMPVSPDR